MASADWTRWRRAGKPQVCSPLTSTQPLWTGVRHEAVVQALAREAMDVDGPGDQAVSQVAGAASSREEMQASE